MAQAQVDRARNSGAIVPFISLSDSPPQPGSDLRQELDRRDIVTRAHAIFGRDFGATPSQRQERHMRLRAACREARRRCREDSGPHSQRRFTPKCRRNEWSYHDPSYEASTSGSSTSDSGETSSSCFIDDVDVDNDGTIINKGNIYMIYKTEPEIRNTMIELLKDREAMKIERERAAGERKSRERNA